MDNARPPSEGSSSAALGSGSAGSLGIREPSRADMRGTDGGAPTPTPAGSPVRLDDPEYAARIARKLTQIAWFRYRIPVQQAEDVVQTAFTAFLEVRHRYESVADHPAILVGVFRKKCLEFIDRAVREKRKLDRYCASPDAARENPWIRPARSGEAPSVLDEIVHREEREQISQAIRELRPRYRSLVQLLAEKGFDRQKVIEHLRLNKNTVDSRLHVTRRELRRLLLRHEITA